MATSKLKVHTRLAEISAAKDKPEKAFKTVDAWKAACKKHGYKVSAKKNERLGEFFIAEYKDDVAGSFSSKYPKDSWLLSPTDRKFKKG